MQRACVLKMYILPHLHTTPHVLQSIADLTWPDTMQAMQARAHKHTSSFSIHVVWFVPAKRRENTFSSTTAHTEKTQAHVTTRHLSHRY